MSHADATLECVATSWYNDGMNARQMRMIDWRRCQSAAEQSDNAVEWHNVDHSADRHMSLCYISAVFLLLGH